MEKQQIFSDRVGFSPAPQLAWIAIENWACNPYNHSSASDD
jgi:hypothetical protein